MGGTSAVDGDVGVNFINKRLIKKQLMDNCFLLEKRYN